MAEHADAERVDQRVAEVRRVEDRLATDVGQAQTVAVAADTSDNVTPTAGGSVLGRVGSSDMVRVPEMLRRRSLDAAAGGADASRQCLPVRGTKRTGSTSRSVIFPSALFSTTVSCCPIICPPTGTTSRPPGASCSSNGGGISSGAAGGDRKSVV